MCFGIRALLRLGMAFVYDNRIGFRRRCCLNSSSMSISSRLDYLPVLIKFQSTDDTRKASHRPRYAMPTIPSIKLLGKITQTVPTIAMIEHIIIKAQSSVFSFLLILLPKSRRWNAKGRMMQMLNAIADPIRAMIVSKLGTRIAITIITTTVAIRIADLRKPWVYPERPRRLDARGIPRGSRPTKFSMILKMGRALHYCQSTRGTELKLNAYFNGILVIGIMAMKTTIHTDMLCGYPLVKSMLDVTSSCTFWPNIKKPATAIRASRRYCSMISHLNDVVGNLLTVNT